MDENEKHALKKEEIHQSLNVDGYAGFLDFDDDIFLLDYWNYQDGLNYLVGIASIDTYSGMVGDDYEDFKRIRTLDHDYYLEENESHIVYEFLRILRRLERIWDSGGHAESNSPTYYIEWAISKNHKIPWLKYAIEKGFYVPQLNQAKSAPDKPLLNRERETMLKIIHALAKNGYCYPNHGALGEMIKDFELNQNGVSEKTLKKYLDEFNKL